MLTRPIPDHADALDAKRSQLIREITETWPARCDARATTRRLRALEATLPDPQGEQMGGAGW